MTQNILIIDDDPAVRGAFQLILGEIGFKVRLAEDGLQGIEMANAERPDLIFLDLKMPGIDGVETMRRLLAMDSTLNIYLVTAFSQEYFSQLKAAQDENLRFQLANKPLSSNQIRHIARSALKLTNTNDDSHRIILTLYVVTINPEVQQLVDQLNTIFSATYQPGFWTLNLVEVLNMPEKALARDIFATPMLVRELPEPVLKLLGNLSKMSSVIAAITSQSSEGVGTILL